ncbi:MAG: methyl-accepting chemotaxis protein, partial [Boseongicola sp.]|nr:methyl-accepting chemotaxis protein [Boseongicola sp.]
MFHDTDLSEINRQERSQRLAKNASQLGRRIVEISGALNALRADTESQNATLTEAKDISNALIKANKNVRKTASEVNSRAETTSNAVETALTIVKDAAPAMQSLANWVMDLQQRAVEVEAILMDVLESNDRISSIAAQVNILAINAKIEAARAGEAGRSFAVVADAVNELSQNTAGAAKTIDGQITGLTSWMEKLQLDTQEFGPMASDVRAGAANTAKALLDVAANVERSFAQAASIEDQARRSNEAASELPEAFANVRQAFSLANSMLSRLERDFDAVVDNSEEIVQETFALGGKIEDGPLIERVQDDARIIGRLFEAELEHGNISENAMFSTKYEPLPNTNPQQHWAPCVETTDKVLPQIQEAALQSDPRVIFCAAVDTNGYLPTHNAAFSHPQSDDPVWNAAHCRNRRIFGDRVGLKAGQNTKPFLLQVYR